MIIEVSYTSLPWEIDKLKTSHNTLNVEDIAWNILKQNQLKVIVELWIAND